MENKKAQFQALITVLSTTYTSNLCELVLTELKMLFQDVVARVEELEQQLQGKTQMYVTVLACYHKPACERKIEAIKAYRAICHGVSLRDAKNGIESLMTLERTYTSPEKVCLYADSSSTFQENIAILEQWFVVVFETR